MNNPQITILMSAYNAEKYIGEAIESVLSQTLTDFEFIIINDASTDNTLNEILSFSDSRIKIINNKTNIGLTKSLNIGLNQAQGEFIARLDADDIALPNRLEKQLGFMNTHPQIVLVGSAIQNINDEGTIMGEKIRVCTPAVIKYEIIFANPFFHSTIFFKKNKIRTIGGYNENYRYAQDFELYSRLSEKYKLANMPNYLIKFRSHRDSIMAKTDSQKLLRYNALKIIYNNINIYAKINQADFTGIKELLIIKGSSEKVNFNTLVKTLKLNKKIYQEFKKRNILNKKDKNDISKLYQRRMRLIFKRFLLGIKNN